MWEMIIHISLTSLLLELTSKSGAVTSAGKDFQLGAFNDQEKRDSSEIFQMEYQFDYFNF